MISSQTFIQAAPSMAWTINHSFNGAPICDVMIVEGGVTRKMLPLSVKHVSNTQLLIEFSEPTAGMARLVGKYIGGWVGGAGSVDLGQYYVAPPAPGVSFANVSLLLHGDGVDGSTTIIDSSNNAFVPAVTGGVQIDTAEFFVGSSSIQFTGDGYVQFPASSTFQFGTADFALEYLVRRSTNAVPSVDIDFRPSASFTSETIAIYQNGGMLHVYVLGNNIMSATAPPPNQWAAIALDRVADVFTLRIDGVAVSTFSAGTYDFVAQDKLTIGGSVGNNTFLTGHIQELRITKGVARHTADYTVQSAPFPNS